VIEININWKEIDPTNFEKFIAYLLEKLNFHNITWFGKGGGDKGRDIVAYTTEYLPLNLSYQRKWIIQCKRWSKFPSNTQIFNEIDTALEHKPDFWVLAIPLDPTANKIDYIENISKNYRNHNFKTKIISLNDIEKLLFKFPESKNILLKGSVLEDEHSVV